MNTKEKAWLRLQLRDDRLCATEGSRWADPGGPRQTEKLKATCASCPALDDCRAYADSLDPWERRGVLAAESYKAAHRCEVCAEVFSPRRAAQVVCSNRCRGIKARS